MPYSEEARYQAFPQPEPILLPKQIKYKLSQAILPQIIYASHNLHGDRKENACCILSKKIYQTLLLHVTEVVPWRGTGLYLNVYLVC